MSTRIRDVSVITAQFGDERWLRKLLAQLVADPSAGRLREVLVVDQNRNGTTIESVRGCPLPCRVIAYPREENYFRVMGHDHPWVLDRAVAEAAGEWCAIFDSDAHPIAGDWLDTCEKVLGNYDGLLAAEVPGSLRTHPCFMLVPKKWLERVTFCRGVLDKTADTGRLVGAQLVELGANPLMLSPRTAFSGLHGDIYASCIYHHGHGSFVYMNDYGRSLIRPTSDRIASRVLLKGRYSLSLPERIARGGWRVMKHFRTVSTHHASCPP